MATLKTGRTDRGSVRRSIQIRSQLDQILANLRGRFARPSKGCRVRPQEWSLTCPTQILRRLTPWK
jgi:hypothetical protein